MRTRGDDPPYRLARFIQADLVRYYTLAGIKPSTLRVLIGLFSPRFAPVFIYRLAYKAHRLRLGPIAKLLSLFNFVVFGIEIGSRCFIGEGLFLPHTQGTVIGASSIGANCTIFQGVTLGAKEIDIAYSPHLRPTLRDNVSVGAGAKVIGGIELGDGVTIGANAVVLISVPANCTAVGVPARIIQKSK